MRRVLVYGGRGALGSKIVEMFKQQKWWACSVDIAANEHADVSIVVRDTNDWQEQAKQVEVDVEKALNNEKVDAILCVAGGWSGGNAAAKDFVQSCDRMWKQSVWTSVIAANLAATFLKEDGLLQLTGAKACLESTPTMIGYGMAKAAVHHLVQSLRSKRSGLHSHSTTVAILPVTLDTPMNRQSMPKADFGTWTPLEFVAKQLFEWADEKEKRPATGSLVELITKNGQTDLVIGQLNPPPTPMTNY